MSTPDLDTFTEEHIREGAFLYYNGFTSTGAWACPAVVTRVDTTKKTFHIRSLDDMKEQHQTYDFAVGANSPDSRRTMRPYSRAEAETWVSAMADTLCENLAKAEEALERQRGALAMFERQRQTLFGTVAA